jgi:very-short-patch-repair endonuclease
VKAPSALEAEFDLQVLAFRLPTPEREYRFHPVRGWLFDRAWPEHRVAVELEGLTAPWARAGRHQRAEGYAEDCTKYSEAQLLGWKVLRFTRHHLGLADTPGGSIHTLKRALALTEPPADRSAA